MSANEDNTSFDLASITVYFWIWKKAFSIFLDKRVLAIHGRFITIYANKCPHKKGHTFGTHSVTLLGSCHTSQWLMVIRWCFKIVNSGSQSAVGPNSQRTQGIAEVGLGNTGSGLYLESVWMNSGTIKCCLYIGPIGTTPQPTS